MKAVVYTQYGGPGVLQLKQVEKPTPGDREVLIKIKATAVNSGDWRLRKADPFAVRFFFGLMKPKKHILGGVLSGEIEAIGKDVTLYRVGDQVFGSTGLSFGAYAEYKCLPEDAVLAFKPESLTHQEAAVIPFGGTVSLYFLRKANIKNGQKVLVNGASGAVGTAAIQLASHFGAHVTGICSTGNVNLVKSLGADKVIDYTKDDFSKNGETYDVIYDTVNSLSVSDCSRSLNKNGILLLGAAGLSEMIQGLWASVTRGNKVISGMITEKAADMAFLQSLIEEGKFRSVIDRTYSLEQIGEAHHYAENGHKKGNVSILLSDN